MGTEICPVCKEGMQYKSLGSRDAYSVICPRCGNYHLTRTAMVNLRSADLSDRQRANMSGWLFENQVFEVNTANIDWLSKIPTPSFHERADKLLLGVEELTKHAGEHLRTEANKNRWIGVGWCINEDELYEIVEYLISSSRISGDINFIKVSPDGWAHLESLKKLGADSEQCFVAMWFDNDMQLIYDNPIANGILDAGYKPHRVDQREHNDKIDDEIIAQIRRSRFVLADFTGHRGGVYYEAGFAKGLGLEVIWTCREDGMDDLHFDIRQYNCIPWTEDKLDDFRKKIQNRIERIFGRGSYTNEA